MIYLLCKFVHICAAVVWIGSLVTVYVINLRLRGTAQRPLQAALARQGEFLGARLMGPAAGVTLLAGLATDWAGGFGLPLWILWGLAALVVSATLGATVLRRAVARLAERLESGREAEIARARRRAAILQGANLALLASAAWAMVFKPAL